MMNRRQFLKITGMAGADLVSRLLLPESSYGISERKILEQKSEDILLAMMIYGETSGCEPREKIFAGITPFNRLNDGRKYNGEGSLKEVLLHPNQYSCFDNTTKNRENLRRILHPKKEEIKEWHESLIIAKGLLRGEWEYYNFGQTHFYKKSLIRKLKQGKLKIDPNRLQPIDSRGFKHQFYKEI